MFGDGITHGSPVCSKLMRAASRASGPREIESSAAEARAAPRHAGRHQPRDLADRHAVAVRAPRQPDERLVARADRAALDGDAADRVRPVEHDDACPPSRTRASRAPSSTRTCSSGCRRPGRRRPARRCPRASPPSASATRSRRTGCAPAARCARRARRRRRSCPARRRARRARARTARRAHAGRNQPIDGVGQIRRDAGRVAKHPDPPPTHQLQPFGAEDVEPGSDRHETTLAPLPPMDSAMMAPEARSPTAG